MKVFGFEPPNRVYGFLPASSTAIEVMYSGIRAIQADLDRQAVAIWQHLKLLEALSPEQSAVTEHGDSHAFQAVAQHSEDVMQDERLTTGNQKLRHSYLNCFIDEGADLWKRKPISLRAHKGLCNAVATGEVAVGVCVDPETIEETFPVPLRPLMGELHHHSPHLTYSG